MPEEDPPQPPAPRPVIPIEPDEPIDAQILGDGPAGSTPPNPVPVMPIAEPGVAPPAPFAQVYSPPAAPVAPAYYPPAYPPPANYGPPGQPPAPPGYPPPAVYPPAWPEPVDYRSAMVRSYSRPGIITAVAVTAIIVSGLSIITSFFSGCTSAMVMGNARGMTATRTATAIPSQGTMAGKASMPSVNALAQSDRAAVLQALSSRRTLSEPRQRQLNAFLSEHGKLVFDDSGAGLTIEKVKASLSDAGQEFANAGNRGPDFFAFKSGGVCKLPGRLRLFDDRAVYKPDDYSPDLRSAAKAEDDSSNPPAAASNGLDDDQVRAVIGSVQGLTGNNLNAAQSNTLTSLLQSPVYTNYLQDSSTIPGLTAQVRSAAVADDGTVIITFTMGKLTLDPRGNPIGPMPTAPAPTTSPITPLPPGWATGTLAVNQTSCSLGLAEAIVSGLLGIYLLVIAILSLRQNSIGRKFYLIYIALKIVCGVVAIVAFGGIISSLSATSNGAFSVAQSMSQVFGGFATAALTFSIIGLIYPIAILLVLTLNKTARDYYRSMG